MDMGALTGQPNDDELPEAPRLPAPPEDQRPTISQGDISEDNLLGRLQLCRFCSAYHASFCPYIQKISWHESGILASVELKDRVADLKALTFASFQEMQEALEANGVHIETEAESGEE